MTIASNMPFIAAVTVTDGTIIVVRSGYQLQLTASHPMRRARCVICRQPIGDQLATLIGTAALTGVGCACGSVPSDVFIAHAAHFPIDPDELTDTLTRALSCADDHDRFDVI